MFAGSCNCRSLVVSCCFLAAFLQNLVSSRNLQEMALQTRANAKRYRSSPPPEIVPAANVHLTSVNPLKDQPNMSVKDEDAPIRGSKKAVTITRLEYLKKEWCKTEPLKQIVREEGCAKRVIINNFCYGQCNSFFIPKSGKKDKKHSAFKSCGFCRPKRQSRITVTLRCYGKNNKPKLKRKRIMKIKQCKCMARKVH
jgi:hypothetical protein